ncbi:MAG: lolD 3 [Verrucomicrobiales bacterium]|nr:lolD 3 [Verrucomicrobiales bacterium]MDB6130972.1 lolD 3 [Verrucomicrobiales bacterium]
MSEETILKIENLTKTYATGDHRLTVLQGVTFSVQRGGTCAIIGPSGSGKTTLLGLCAGLDNPTEGRVVLDGNDFGKMTEEERATLRRNLVGFVFQNFQLLPTLTALENVMVPLELNGGKSAQSAATELMIRVGLGDRLDHYPTQLSGGEQQRVALARAFINRPQVVFADEPTGNLDSETSQRIVDLIFEVNREFKTTLVLITHDPELAQKTGQVIKLRGGKTVS